MNKHPRPLQRLLERWHFDRHLPAGPLTTAEKAAADERDGIATIAESVDPRKAGSAS